MLADVSEERIASIFRVEGKIRRFVVLTVVIVKKPVFWDMASCIDVVLPDVSEERIASIFRVEGTIIRNLQATRP